MTRLLCATDLLPKSERAIDRAGMLAEELGAELSLLHVVSPASGRVLEQSLQVAIASMRTRARAPQWRHGPTPQVLVRTGNPARLICETLVREESDLLIVGPHERRNVLEGLSGTIAEKALSARRCPVLLAQASTDTSYQRVLLALDLSPESALAVRTAESLGVRSATQTIALHVSQPPIRGMLPSASAEETSRAMQKQAAADIRELLIGQSSDPDRYEVLIEEGHPIPNILSAIEHHKPQLLVVGTRAVGRMRRALLGSVASQLLQNIVDCDVLVVPRDALSASLSATGQKSSA